MRQVVPPFGIVQRILGEQKTDGGTSYRLSRHCMCVEQPEGTLLYHTMTGELLLLSRREAGALGALPDPLPAELGALVPRWFLRPEGADDMALADQVRAIAERFQKKETTLTRYTIFTTTACNARCFYCFEAGWKKSSMTDETARRTAAYIRAHCGGKPVDFHWFGGEPLVNVRAIDVITDYLRERGVEFRSTMTSNGYLFDQELAKRAREAWNLETVQITLDGPEAVYNTRKAYVNPEGSPFQRVLRNIGMLLVAGIRVEIRLNLDGDNERDLYTLIDQLAERFAGNPSFGISLMLIKKKLDLNSPTFIEGHSSNVPKLQVMRTYVEEKDMTARLLLRRGFTVSSCLADSGSSTTVMPDGRLGRCESLNEGGLWGSVFSDERDEAVLRQWKERKPPEAACRDCAFYPQCIRLKVCPDWAEQCSVIKRLSREDKIRRAILGSYEEWKAAGQS